MRYMMLLLLACGEYEHPALRGRDGGEVVTFGVNHLNKLKLECKVWYKRQFIDTSGVHDYWWCDMWVP
jgi:hypothetical protein